MTGALVPKQLSWCTDIKLCNRALWGNCNVKCDVKNECYVAPSCYHKCSWLVNAQGDQKRDLLSLFLVWLREDIDIGAMSTMLQGFICGAYVCPHLWSNCNSWWVSIQSQLIEHFGATNFGWNNIVPLHNSTLLNVDIKQMWCLVLALLRLSKWTDVKISGEFAPCRIHNWLWLAVEFAIVTMYWSDIRLWCNCYCPRNIIFIWESCT